MYKGFDAAGGLRDNPRRTRMTSSKKDPGRPGRRKEIDTPGFKLLSTLLPQEVWRALKIYCFRNDKKQAAIIRDRLERFLESEGLLKIHVTRDDEGRELRSYEVRE